MARVLIIDDDRFVRRVVEANLVQQGYEVDTAANGQEGLERVRAVRPDAIVSDKMMPVMDGLEFIRRLRRDPRFSTIPVLVLTSSSDLDIKLDAFESGADDYLSKPFEAAELSARVAALLRRAEAHAGRPADESQAGSLIAVHSLRGGVGSTSLCVNLGYALSEIWERPTLLLDLVLDVGQIALMLNKPLQHSWADLAHLPRTELEPELLRKLVLKYSEKLHVMASPANPLVAEGLAGEILTEARSQFSQLYSYVVADLPHNFSEPTLDALEAADHILVPLAPELASVKAASVALTTYEQLGFKLSRVKLVLNRTFEQGQLAQKQIEAALKRPIFLNLPFAPLRFVEAINRGQPILENHPRSDIAIQLEDFAFGLSKEEHREHRPAQPSPAWLRMQERRDMENQAGLKLRQKGWRLLSFS